ncbi:MAG: hypothetical protein PHQ62_02165 [Clostridia bacterium]|nr:hypothetical protein [Clostridia bacterium]
MKKFFKKLSFAMAILLSFSLAFPILAKVGVYADPEPTNIITIRNFKTTGIKDTVYNITQADQAGAQVTAVKDPLGRNVGIQDGEGDSKYFIPNYTGTYKITYTLGSRTAEFNVAVSKASAQGTEIKFEENSQYIVPSKINPNNNGENTSVILPNPYVVDKNGDVVDSATVTIDAFLDGVLISLEAETVGEGEDAVEYKKLILDKDTEGTYLIKYKYSVDGSLIAFTTKTIVADTGYANDYLFTYDYKTSKPSTAEIGVATKLPQVTAKNDNTKEEVNVHYSVKAEITKGTTTKTYNLNDTDNDVITFVDGYFYFTPILDGNYVITYTVTNFAGNPANVPSSSFTIQNVADTTKAVPLPVLPYVLTDGVLETYTDATEAVFSNVSDDENIYIMPIYATDNANGIAEDNLTLYRTIVLSSQSTVLFNEKDDLATIETNKVLLFNASEEYKTMLGEQSENFILTTIYINGNPVPITKAQVYVVDSQYNFSTGTYNINYNANDKANNGINSKTYQMTVTSGYEDTVAPTVTFKENLPAVMFGTDEITFSKPTATDNKDTRLSVYLKYQITDSVEGALSEKSVDDADSIITYNETTQKYTLKLPETGYENTTKIEIFAYSNDDSYAGDTEANLGFVSKTINILYSGDTGQTSVVDPIGDWLPDTEQDYKQGNDILLPTVSYSDDLVNYIKYKIIVENNGTYFNVFDTQAMRNGTTLTLQNAKFTADLSGTYNITYITTDAGNNITVVFFQVDIDVDPATLSCAFTGLPSQINNGTAERGVSFDLPNNVAVYLSDTNALEIEGEIQLLVSGGEYQTDRQNVFTAYEVGTYKIQYYADVRLSGDSSVFIEGGLKSKVFIIEVVDTTAPIANYVEAQNFFDDWNATGFTKGESLILPTIDLDAVDDLDLSKSYISITSSYGTTTFKFNETTTITVDDELQTILKLFANQPFEKDDVYTITYNLIDFSGNTSSKSFTLNVGDVEPPVLDIDSTIIKEQYKIGDKVKVDLSKISATDNNIEGDIINYDEATQKYSVVTGTSITITLKNTTTGATITNDLTSSSTNLNYQYTIETAGEYTLTISVSDKAGKTSTYSDSTFTVSSNENTGLDTEEILGIVLIVLSVVLLGGVIAYFVVSKKNLEKKYK